jgi:hypothetical protein
LQQIGESRACSTQSGVAFSGIRLYVAASSVNQDGSYQVR